MERPRLIGSRALLIQRDTKHPRPVCHGEPYSAPLSLAALGLILLLLGAGLGLAAVSPWSYEGASAKTVGIAAIAWMIFTHLSASAMGGYRVGRLRTKIGSNVDRRWGGEGWSDYRSCDRRRRYSGGRHANEGSADLSSYFIDTLFRSDRSREEDDSSVRNGVGRIFANGLRQNDLPAADKNYLAQVVAARTCLGQPEAEKRVAEAIAKANKARQAADAARKAAAHLSLWTFVALLSGAFTASYAATIGGRQRDYV